MRIRIVIVLLLIVLHHKNYAQNSVSGLISTNTTWEKSGSPYRLTSDVVIMNGITLNVSPGVEVLFDQNVSLRVLSGGKLIVKGTKVDSIRISMTNPANTSGIGGIIFNSGSIGSVMNSDTTSSTGSIFEYCKFNKIKGSLLKLESTDIFIKNCSIVDNQTVSGAIISDFKSLYIYSSEFRNNKSSSNGGVFYKDNSSSNIGALIIYNSIFSQNKAEAKGGVIYVARSSGSKIVNSIFNKNTSKEGGAIYYSPGSSDAISNYKNCVFRENSSQSGGAIWSSPVGNNFINCEFISNKSIEVTPINDFNGRNLAGKGGAILYLGYSPGGIYVENCKFVNNISGNGSAIYSFSYWNSLIKITSKSSIFYDSIESNIGEGSLINNSGNRGEIGLENSYIFSNHTSNSMIYGNIYGSLNSFINLASGVILKYPSSSAYPLNVKNNYWNSLSIDDIKRYITDFYDDPNLNSPIAEFQPFHSVPAVSNIGLASKIQDINLKSNINFNDLLSKKVLSRDTLFIEVKGVDKDSLFRGSTVVYFKNSRTNEFFQKNLIESNNSSGLYQGIVYLSANSDSVSSKIVAQNDDFILLNSREEPLINKQIYIGNKDSQVINFQKINDIFETVGAFNLVANSSSNLTVNFESIDLNKLTVLGNIATIKNVGKATVKALQIGNDNFRPAQEVTQTFCILPKKPEITDTGIGKLISSTKSNIQWFKDGQILQNQISDELIVNEPGIYFIRCNVDGCFTDSDKLSVVNTCLNLKPIISLPDNLNFCSSADSLILKSGALTGMTVKWFSSANLVGSSPDLIVKSSGTYRLNITTLGGCSNEKNIIVNKINSPVAPTITNSTPLTFCAGQNVVLTSNGVNNQWYMNGNAIANATTATFTANASGAYKVKAISGDCSSPLSSAVTVLVNAVPDTPKITNSSSLTFCTGQNVVLTSSGINNQWYLNDVVIYNATSTTLTVTASGVYKVKSLNGDCSSPLSSATTVVVNTIPDTPTITNATPLTFCSGQNVVLTSSGTNNQWYLNGNAIANATAATFTANAAGAYKVKATNGDCSSALSATSTVVVNPIPPTPLITQESNGGLTSSATDGNQWYFNDVKIDNATQKTINPTKSGNYTVKVTTPCASEVSKPYSVVITATEETILGQVQLSPNPFLNQFKVSFPLEFGKTAQLKIVDMSGNIQFKKAFVIDGEQIELGNLNGGNYILHLNSNDNSNSKAIKISKIH